MSIDISGQTGKYHHNPAHKAIVTFDSKTGGVPRAFAVLVASAENAGIIGSEYNGLAVLDIDHGQVILDRHMIGRPSAQLEEFERLRSSDWSEFASFCRTHERFRTAMGDDLRLGLDEPEPGNLLSQAANGIIDPSEISGADIRTPEMIAAHENASVPYLFPAKTREAMIAEIAAHSVHRAGLYDDFFLSWDIKVGNYDETGRSGDYQVNADFDDRWARFEQSNPVFSEACADAVSWYVDGEYCTCNGDDQGSYKFGIQGRSGGHMVLEAVDGERFQFSGQGDMIEHLAELGDERLAGLYRAVKSLDHDLRPEANKQSVDYHVNLQRNSMEEEWRNEMAFEA